MSKKIVIVSDVQDGHRLSVCTDTPTLSQIPPAEPTIYRPNRIQRALFKAWKEVTSEWNRPDILIINGEPIEGQQYKNMGTEVWSTDLNDQLNDAQKLIEMFNAKKIYTTRGSDYHVSLKGVPLEEAFGKMIGATQVGGYYAPYEMFLEEEGVTFDIAHHVGYNMEFYRSTAITREMAFAKLNESHRWPAKVIVRSHVHYYWFVGSTSHLSMTTPCIPEGTTNILTDNGLKEVQNVSLGEKVLSHDGQHHIVMQKHKRNYLGDIYSIKPTNMPPFYLTPEHPVFVRKLLKGSTTKRIRQWSEPLWIEAKNLQKGDVVLHPIANNINQTTLSKEEALLYGYYLAEGTRTSRSDVERIGYGLRFTFNKLESEYINDVVQLIKYVYGKDASIKERKNSQATDVFVGGKELTRKYFMLLGANSYEKHLPFSLLSAPLPIQSMIVCGLFRGDGCTSLNRYKLTLVSRLLINQIRQILLRMGITTTFSISPSKVDKRGTNHAESYTITIESKDGTQKLDEITGMRANNYYPNDIPRRVWVNNDYLHTPITSIGKSYWSGNVYNLGVEESNSYQLEGGMVHNCWKLQDWFMRRKTSAGGVPDIGAVRFTVEDGEYEWHAKIFKMPDFKPIFIRDGKEVKAK